MIKEMVAFNVEGHIKIVDMTGVDTTNFDIQNVNHSKLVVLEDKRNAIHYENMSVAMAQSLIGHDGFLVDSLGFGNGGSIVSGTNTLYNTPNTIGSSSTLYNLLFKEKINSKSGSVVQNTTNMRTDVRHLVGNSYTDIIITCILDNSFSYAESGSSNVISNFSYDELGIFDKSGRMLTHVVFNKKDKTINGKVGIFYTLRISTVAGSQ